MRIAILSTDFPPVRWGIANLSRDIARVCSAEASVTVLAPRVECAECFDLREPYRVIRVANLGISREASFIQSLLHLHRLESIDVLICGTWIPAGLSAYLFYRLRGIPYLVWAHGSDIVDDWRTPRRIIKSCLRPLKRTIIGHAAGIIANSQYTRELVKGQGVPPSAIHVIVPAVDTDRFRPGVPSASMSRLRKGAQHCLLTVARLDAHKGHRQVIRALAYHLRDMTGLRYLIAGSGPEERTLRRLVDNLGLNHAVDFLGFVPDEDLPDLYRVADVVVMPSAFLPGRWDLIEGFGIAYAEASASGKPVIGGRSGGTEDAVQDGVTGILVDPDDVGALAKAMRILLTDLRLSEQVGRAGRKWACENLSLRQLRDHVLTLASSVRGTTRDERVSVPLVRVTTHRPFFPGWSPAWRRNEELKVSRGLPSRDAPTAPPCATINSDQVEIFAAQRFRVLHLITRLTMGGAQDETLLTVAHLDRTRYEVTLASGPSSGPEGSLEDRIPSGIAFERIHELIRDPHPVKDAMALRRLYVLIQRGRYHIVHTHTTKAGILGRIAARLARVPVVVHTPHGHAFHDYLNSVGSEALKWVERWLAHWTDRIVCVSETERQEHLRLRIGSPEKFEVISSCADIERFRQARHAWRGTRRDFGLPPNGPLVGCVARLVPVKGVHYLLEAVPSIRAVVPEATVLFVGDGPLRPELERRAADLGLNGAVAFLGLRRDVPEIVALCDVVVLPSLNEGMGKVAAEALAAGRPVIGSRVGGIQDVIIEGETGLLVPPADPKALAHAIIRCLTNPTLAVAMSQRAKDTVGRYDPELMVTKIDHLYSQLLAIVNAHTRPPGPAQT